MTTPKKKKPNVATRAANTLDFIVLSTFTGGLLFLIAVFAYVLSHEVVLK